MPQQTPDPVRFAAVGLGHIMQVAVLPAFQHAEHAELAALVSGDDGKLSELSGLYGVERTASYDEYDALLGSGAVDAVYIGLPNHLHAEYAVRAARAGVHVLCEKPMAVTEAECLQMIRAARGGGAHLMVAYRLHFDDANMRVAEMVRGGAIGEPRFFHSAFAQNVRAGDVRLVSVDRGGGPVYDMGVYCINAARYLFEAEPIAVLAHTARSDDPRFDESEEMASVVLEFPDDRLASFTVSFGSHDVDAYRVLGTEGEIRMQPAYSYVDELAWELVVDGVVEETGQYAKRDQFAPEIEHLARCIREDEAPEPDGWEGLADVCIVRSIYESVESGERVELDPVHPRRRPGPEQAASYPGIDEPDTVNVQGP